MVGARTRVDDTNTGNRLIASERKSICRETGQVERSWCIGETEVNVRAIADGRCRGDDDLTAAADDRAAGVGVVAGESRRATAKLYHVTRSADHVGECQVISTVEGKDTVVGNRSRADVSVGRAVTDRQGAGRGDQGHAGVAVGSGDEERTASDLTDASRSGDRAGEYGGIGEVESQRPVVADWAAPERAVGSPIADLERAVGDRCRPGVGVVARQDRGAVSDESERTGTRDYVTEKQGAALIED